MGELIGSLILIGAYVSIMLGAATFGMLFGKKSVLNYPDQPKLLAPINLPPEVMKSLEEKSPLRQQMIIYESYNYHFDGPMSNWTKMRELRKTSLAKADNHGEPIYMKILYETALEYIQIWTGPLMILRTLFGYVIFVINFFAVGPGVAINFASPFFGRGMIQIGNTITAVLFWILGTIGSILAFMGALFVISFLKATLLYVPSTLVVANVAEHFFENYVGLTGIGGGL